MFAAQAREGKPRRRNPNLMKKIIASVFCTLLLSVACSKDAMPDEGESWKKPVVREDLAEQNLLRAMQIVDKALETYFSGTGMAMSRYYNPYNGSHANTEGQDEPGSVWMYTSAIEGVNAIMHGLEAFKAAGNSELYEANYARYAEALRNLYENADHYKGTFTLTSYTQTREWTVYGVNRSDEKGKAEVEGIMNVYDDQMWLVRELFEAYRLTGDEDYLKQSEYLTEYVLDGWDCALDPDGKEYGGITWGPGYVTKHSCSNGPMVSPLVWLHEYYKGKADQITYRYIAADGSRESRTVKKADYYLDFAKKVYDYQKTHLLRPDGVYDDMMGGDDTGGKVAYETVDGVEYRKHTNLRDRVGPAISYNSGTMLSGAADLYRATGDETYASDLRKLSDASFTYFAKLDKDQKGYYSYSIDGFNNWFNGVLMRGYADAVAVYPTAAQYLETFQQNLDYGYDNHFYKSMLPTNLLVGWSYDRGHNATEGMFTFAFASEYAVLSRYELGK